MGLYLGKEKVSNVASVITQNADSMATKMQNHITDTDIHITADERTKWNAAADNTEDFASTGVMNTNINMNNNSIKNLATPIENNDAANKGYVDNKALPTTSTSDNGKVLSVVNGAWAAAAMSSGAYIGKYTGNGSSSKTFTFNFKPAFILFFLLDTDNICRYQIGWINGMSFATNMQDIYRLSVSQSGNNITFTDEDGGPPNISSTKYTYYYIAIPAMN